MSALRSASTVLISIVLSTSGMAGSTRTCRNQQETTTAFFRCKSSEEHSAVTPAATRTRIPPGPLRQPEPAETCQTRTRAAHLRVEPSVTSRPYVERLGRRLLRSEGGLRRGRVDGRRRWLLGVPLRWLRQ
jgi:hypothetical protein